MTQRILKEYKELKQNPPENCFVEFINENDVFRWRGIILGPSNTPFEGGRFRMMIEFPKEYPLKPFAIHFITKIYHPQVNNDGKICLDVLSKNWNPGITVGIVLTQLVMLLREPAIEEAIQPSIASEMKHDMGLYKHNAMEWTRMYAQEK